MAFPIARTTDMHTCPMVTGVVPHVGGPILPPCSINVQAGTLPVARLGDMATCVGPPDVIAMGASTVLTNGLPTIRLMDVTVHGGMITAPGLPTVLVGDPAFALPPNIKLDGPPDFENKTIRDLYQLSTTPTGAALLAALGKAGQPVTIIPCPDPNNSFCSPASNSDAKAGTPTGSTIQYNPDIKLTAYDSSGNRIAETPAVVLGHEMCHALANSNGTHKYGTDPAGPASQPNIEEEEAQAIGTGSHSSDSPTENGMRSDLGLPRRDNHFGDSPKPGDPNGPKRPGDP
jgi:uncharacterized Zn-binding protein involved in type VI secretion